MLTSVLAVLGFALSAVLGIRELARRPVLLVSHQQLVNKGRVFGVVVEVFNLGSVPLPIRSVVGAAHTPAVVGNGSANGGAYTWTNPELPLTLEAGGATSFVFNSATLGHLNKGDVVELTVIWMKRAAFFRRIGHGKARRRQWRPAIEARRHELVQFAENNY